MIRFTKIAFFVVAIAAVTASTASADTIGPSCGTCQGSTYTLTNLGLASLDLDPADGSFDTYRIALTINTSGYTGGGTDIDEVAIKVASSVDKAVLESAPGAVSDWTLQAGGLNANGCTGSGSGFECSDWIVGSPTGAVVNGSLLTWIFDVDVASPLLTGDDAASIKARYVDGSGNKVGALVSEGITLTPVPEPGTLSLLGIGFGAVILRKRRA
jgi:hypothetical protein